MTTIACDLMPMQQQCRNWGKFAYSIAWSLVSVVWIRRISSHILVDSYLDSGYQEYSTAESCVKSVFPGAKIVANRVDKYPIRVTVSAQIDGTNVEVWSGRQQDLFSKYASKRSQAMAMMKANLQDLKEEFEE